MISIIIPVYNEEQNIPNLVEKIQDSISLIPYNFELLVINDGSSDNSISEIRKICNYYRNCYFISFSRNFGQQNALLAGYDYAKGDAVITMDADLQNPPEMIAHMIKKWELGYEIVLCKRKRIKQDKTVLKGLTSKIFYKILRFLSDVNIESNSPDFRLLDSRVVQIIRQIQDYDVFLRGIISWVGFQRATIYYDHGLRLYGQTKYSFLKMANLAIAGLTSFSVKPLYIAIYLGLFFSIIGLLYVPYVIISYLNGGSVDGWSSLIITIAFFGGVQLLILGIMGVYIGKIFMQGKGRPRYVIKEVYYPTHL